MIVHVDWVAYDSSRSIRSVHSEFILFIQNSSSTCGSPVFAQIDQLHVTDGAKFIWNVFQAVAS